MTDPTPDPRAVLLDAISTALNAAGYWLPIDGKKAVVEAVSSLAPPSQTSRPELDRDPEALAWGRSKIESFVELLASFELRAETENDPAVKRGCAVARLLAQRHFLGDGGCVIGIFDERRPHITDQLDGRDNQA
ncbi:hypothetical protein J3A78_002363 [Streptomyces sp. PvR006]|uniref:hypothetical protein n=1 Tax=Streptomyces sp. PvR006 TaxID=2817860 RepID=UPI001AE1489C|nr:hypothetical protein [Streptomyces sp. PvR006]MBP2581885.1 hypothetical protein [Streptomyces sp. PvR006]